MRKSKKIIAVVLSLLLSLNFPFLGNNAVKAATVLYNNAEGNDGAYTYVLWKDYGDTSMTVNGNGQFECWWQNIGNALFREGVKFDCTKKYQQIGNISINFGVDYQPNGNSYLCVYGWTRNPLVEYYIVESWGSWRPPGASSKGTIYVDGGSYDVYETTRVNQPSIDGNTTFKQYWSVRTSKRTSGTISVTEHFKAWEQMGMQMGNLYEASLNIEGYQSSGWANVYSNTVTVGGNGGGNYSSNNGNNYNGNSGNNNSGSSNSSAPGTNQGTVIECESMTKSGQYTGNISSPFNGVALYANNDAVSTNVNFSSGTNDFTLRGASNGSNMARVDLVIGNQTKGTFYFGDANTAEYTIKNVSHGTGNQTVKLVVTADDGTWDGFCDALIIGGSGVSTGNSNGGNSGNNGGNNGGNSGNSGNTGNNSGNNGGNTGSSAVTKQCEDMTKSGQYTGNINNPFGGVALYANNDAVSYTQYFGSANHTFTLRACSNNSNMARVDLVIDNQTKGTFYYGDQYPAEYKIQNVYTGTGNHTVKLVVTADDGNWDAYLDYLKID
ncbi:MAG: glycoside hydrolase family 11 protein [Lachnospiraceae bacterium]|nr:glycoside hydrolase family 11 protein [Lachnospiraceae bacterium]